MKFGISVSQIKEVDLVVEAERAGYDFCWVWDTPMLRSNVWALLALVADRNRPYSPRDCANRIVGWLCFRIFSGT